MLSVVRLDGSLDPKTLSLKVFRHRPCLRFIGGYRHAGFVGPNTWSAAIDYRPVKREGVVYPIRA